MARHRRYTHRPIEARSHIRITNPIHPLYGQEVECVDSYRRNGLLEVFFRLPNQDDVQGLPSWATDVNGPDHFHEKPQSHVLFCFELLLKMSERLAFGSVMLMHPPTISHLRAGKWSRSRILCTPCTAGVSRSCPSAVRLGAKDPGT